MKRTKGNMTKKEKKIKTKEPKERRKTTSKKKTVLDIQKQNLRKESYC